MREDVSALGLGDMSIHEVWRGNDIVWVHIGAWDVRHACQVLRRGHGRRWWWRLRDGIRRSIWCRDSIRRLGYVAWIPQVCVVVCCAEAACVWRGVDVVTHRRSILSAVQ